MPRQLPIYPLMACVPAHGYPHNVRQKHAPPAPVRLKRHAKDAYMGCTHAMHTCRIYIARHCTYPTVSIQYAGHPCHAPMPYRHDMPYVPAMPAVCTHALCQSVPPRHTHMACQHAVPTYAWRYNRPKSKAFIYGTHACPCIAQTVACPACALMPYVFHAPMPCTRTYATMPHCDAMHTYTTGRWGACSRMQLPERGAH